MDIFRFNFEGDPTELDFGEYINGITSVVWTERYAEAGEFEIQAPLSSNIRDDLPIGCLISHTDTNDVMIVENHEIKEQENAESIVIVTGRGLETILEQRQVGYYLAPNSWFIIEYLLAADIVCNQIVKLINDHIDPATSTADNYNGFRARTYLTEGTSAERAIEKGDIYKRATELLPIDDLGLKVVRSSTEAGTNWYNTDFVIHQGEDKRDRVIFSWKSGDLEATNYLFSHKKKKNAFLVMGRYIWLYVFDTNITGYYRRQALVDASDIDGGYQADEITDPIRNSILSKMWARGQQELKNDTNIIITQTDVSDITQWQYRRDYNIGDLVTLDANFGQIATMRVTEYTEIEDENGESGHPTLSLPLNSPLRAVSAGNTLGGFLDESEPEIPQR